MSRLSITLSTMPKSLAISAVRNVSRSTASLPDVLCTHAEARRPKKKLRHISGMADKTPGRPKEGAGRALARREGAGGVPRSKSKSNRETHAALAKKEEHVLRCVDAVVIMH